MAMRLTGLMSGMDTETLIKGLVSAKQTKVDDAKKAQQKLEWKQDAWKELNNKIKKLYNGTLSALRYQSSYSKKVTKISNSSVATILTEDSAMNSVQTLKVEQLAQSGYLTGSTVSKSNGGRCTLGTKLVNMGIEAGSKIEVTTKGKTTQIEVTASMTLSDLTSRLSSAGVKANFDSKTQRLFISASTSGTVADFAITAANDGGTNALDKLGILVYDDAVMAKYEKDAALRNDADAYKKALDAEIASRLKTYTTRQKSLEGTISTIEAKQEEIKKAYEGDDFDQLVNNTDGALDTLRTDIKALEEKGDLTNDEKTQLESLQKKLDSVESYQALQDQLNEAKTELSDVESYLNADGSASDKLTGEVTDWLDDKIARAETVIADTNRKGSADATKVPGQDAIIYLNNAKFEGASNTFEINGLTITCNAETGNETVTLTTQDDTSGIYDMIKKFIKEYSELINEMDKLYNADTAKGYEPLTDEEKDAMSETEIEKWETKIKDSLLRRDSTLSTVSSAFKQIMSSGFTVNGKTMYLSSFGIDTLGYFEAEDNERNAYHINGDEDDETVSGKTNDLMAAISADPNAVMDFFTQLSKSLYSKTGDLMKRVAGYSSSNTVYDDIKMKSDYDDYTKKIADLEKKLQDYEDKWYKKFSAMETAMAKMQSNASAITSLLGGS